MSLTSIRWISSISYIIGLALLLYLGWTSDAALFALFVACYACLSGSQLLAMKIKSRRVKRHILYKGNYYHGVFSKGQSSVGRQMGVLEVTGLDDEMPIFYTDALHEFEVLPFERED